MFLSKCHVKHICWKRTVNWRERVQQWHIDTYSTPGINNRYFPPLLYDTIFFSRNEAFIVWVKNDSFIFENRRGHIIVERLLSVYSKNIWLSILCSLSWMDSSLQYHITSLFIQNGTFFSCVKNETFNFTKSPMSYVTEKHFHVKSIVNCDLWEIWVIYVLNPTNKSSLFGEIVVSNRANLFYKGTTFMKTVSTETHPRIRLLRASTAISVCFNKVCDGYKRDYPLTTRNIFLQYHMTPFLLQKRKASMFL